jgi:hypothetical protein
MPEDTRLALRQADQARTDFAAIESGLEFLMQRISQLMDTRRVAPVLCGVVAFRSVQRRTKRSMALLKTGPNRGFHMFGAKAETDQARRKPP